MHRLLICVVILMLTACSQLRTQPEQPPAPLSTAQEITRAQSMTLQKRGTISVTERGSPDDALRAIAAKANTAGAPYYLVQLVSETVMPGMWYSTATLYGPSTSTGRTP